MYPGVHDIAHDVVAGVVAEGVAKGERVLDCGAGEGGLAMTLRARGFDVIPLDPRPPNGAVAGFVRGAWEALPVRDASVVAVVACASFHHASDAGAAAMEAARALRPGGRLVVVLSPVHGSGAAARRAERVARRRFGNPRYRHLSRQEAARAFGAAGLALEVRAFRVPGWVGLKRRLKAAVGVEQADFPVLVGTKGWAR